MPQTRSSHHQPPPPPSPPPAPPPRTDYELHQRCMHVLDVLEKNHLTFGDFVVGVCYGNPDSRTDDKMKEARESFYQTDCLKKLLGSSYAPPRSPSGGGKRPAGGMQVIKEFAREKMSNIYKEELTRFSDDFTVHDK